MSTDSARCPGSNCGRLRGTFAIRCTEDSHFPLDIAVTVSRCHVVPTVLSLELHGRVGECERSRILAPCDRNGLSQVPRTQRIRRHTPFLRCPNFGVWRRFISPEIVDIASFLGDSSEIQRRFLLTQAGKGDINAHTKLLAPTVRGTEAPKTGGEGA